jgi:hypothetical protein
MCMKFLRPLSSILRHLMGSLPSKELGSNCRTLLWLMSSSFSCFRFYKQSIFITSFREAFRIFSSPNRQKFSP